MNQIYLHLGSNLGNRMINLETARGKIGFTIGRIVKKSSIYETESWGFTGADFLNQCILVESQQKPLEILEKIMQIEADMGRERTRKRYENRIIDIDILLYNTDILSVPGLEIPHKEMVKRRFVLEPLNEIASGFIHPVLKSPIREIMSGCKDKSRIVRYTGPGRPE